MFNSLGGGIDAAEVELEKDSRLLQAVTLTD